MICYCWCAYTLQLEIFYSTAELSKIALEFWIMCVCVCVYTVKPVYSGHPYDKIQLS